MPPQTLTRTRVQIPYSFHAGDSEYAGYHSVSARVVYCVSD